MADKDRSAMVAVLAECFIHDDVIRTSRCEALFGWCHHSWPRMMSCGGAMVVEQYIFDDIIKSSRCKALFELCQHGWPRVNSHGGCSGRVLYSWWCQQKLKYLNLQHDSGRSVRETIIKLFFKLECYFLVHFIDLCSNLNEINEIINKKVYHMFFTSKFCNTYFGFYL